MILLGAFLLATMCFAGNSEGYAPRVAGLIDPAKLATLGERGANPRVQKYVAQLAGARQAGVAPSNVVVQAVALAGMKGTAAQLTAEAMLRNLTIAQRLGCLDAAGLRDMRRGQAPTKPGLGKDFAALWAMDRPAALAYLANDLRLTAGLWRRLVGA